MEDKTKLQPHNILRKILLNNYDPIVEKKHIIN